MDDLMPCDLCNTPTPDDTLRSDAGGEVEMCPACYTTFMQQTQAQVDADTVD